MNLPSISWPQVPLKEITTKIGSGATPLGGKESYKDSGITLIRSLNVYDFYFDCDGLAHIDEQQANQLANVEVQSNDILLNITGASVARCCMVPTELLPARVNQHVSIVRINPTIAEPRFILYCLNSPRYKQLLLNIAQGGATREALTQEKISTFQVPFPYLPVQRKIADILSAYGDLIENNARRIKILEEMAQMTYRAWFVNFQFPGHANVKMIDSELGRIPEGWEVRRVRDVATLHRGKSYRSEDLVDDGGLPFLNLKCIERGGGFRYDGIKRFSGEFKDDHKANPGDIIIAVTDMTQERRLVAHAARVPDIREQFAVMSMDLVRVDPNRDVLREYLYGVFRFSDFSDNVKQHANGVNVLHLNPERIMDHKFALAPLDLRKGYSTMCSSLYELRDCLQLKNVNLRSTRDLLLPKLISGELDVEKLDIDTGGINHE